MKTGGSPLPYPLSEPNLDRRKPAEYYQGCGGPGSLARVTPPLVLGAFCMFFFLTRATIEIYFEVPLFWLFCFSERRGSSSAQNRLENKPFFYLFIFSVILAVYPRPWDLIVSSCSSFFVCFSLNKISLFRETCFFLAPTIEG